MPLDFRPSPRMTLGVEVELQLLDAHTRDLTPAAPRLLELVGAGDPRVKPELFQSMIEINTGICDHVGQARADLAESLASLQAAAAQIGVQLSAVGSHPFARWDERVVFPSERYGYLIDRNQWLARRLLIFGLHVHVGMRDGEHAMAMLNGILPSMPVFLALSASSPFWQGHDTGLCSARATVFEALPTAGHPSAMADWTAFQAVYDALIASRSISTLKDIWADIRPHPDFGTVELRICDGLATLSETMAVVALVHCLYHHLDERYQRGERFAPQPDWLVRENKWRAARWGVEAELVLDAKGRSAPLREVVAGLLEACGPWAGRLQCEAELARVERMVREGGSAERQRRVYENTGSLVAVVDAGVRELSGDGVEG